MPPPIGSAEQGPILDNRDAEDKVAGFPRGSRLAQGESLPAGSFPPLSCGVPPQVQPLVFGSRSGPTAPKEGATSPSGSRWIAGLLSWLVSLSPLLPAQ